MARQNTRSGGCCLRAAGPSFHHWMTAIRTSLNQEVQATAAARFRFLALVVFIRSSCRSHPSPAAVPDLCRWAEPVSQ
jgi:hypothetical protein